MKPAKKQLHEVKAGDTLSSLAATYLGDPARWQTIRDSNKVVVMPDGSQVAVKDLADTAPLPVGATLTVPGKQSLLEQLAPYVAAWDEDDTDEDESGEDEPEDGYEADVEPPDQRDPQPPKLSRRRKKELRLAEAERFKDNPRREITPDALLKGAANLRSPGDTDPEYISAPGLGQSHKVREPLGSDQTEQGKSRRDLEKLSDAENEKLRQKHIDDEADKQYGALSQRQYAHLRMLARADEDEQEAVLAREGKPLDDVIAEKISKRYGPDRVDDARARDIAKQVEAWIAKVPLTITFTADRLFSDPTKNEPKYGSKYASEVTFSRGQEKLGDLIGRDDLHDDTAKVGTTGGTKTGWEERGDNYMRWRRDKDDREGRHDELSYEDQQIFGAANPAFDKAKGGVGKDYGSNYYGSAHFLLNDAVRNRCAFIVRAATGGTDETRAPVQRKNIGMLIYDMLTTTSGNAQFLDAILQNKSGSAKAIAPGLNWEVHLYGGFDIGKDVDTIYLPSDLDKAVARRIRAFARNHGIACAKIGAKPDGLDVLPEMNPKQVELPADDGASEEED